MNPAKSLTRLLNASGIVAKHIPAEDPSQEDDMIELSKELHIQVSTFDGTFYNVCRNEFDKKGELKSVAYLHETPSQMGVLQYLQKALKTKTLKA